MKKLFYILIVLLIASCSKDNYTDDSALSDNDQISNNELKTGWGLNWHIVTDFPKLGDIWCPKPPINCFDEIVVVGVTTLDNCTAKKDTIYYYLSHYYSNDSVDYFLDNYDWDEVFPGLRTSMVDSIIAGYYQIFMVENTYEPDVEIYMVLDDEVNEQNWDDSDVIYAMPIDVQ